VVIAKRLHTIPSPKAMTLFRINKPQLYELYNVILQSAFMVVDQLVKAVLCDADRY